MIRSLHLIHLAVAQVECPSHKYAPQQRAGRQQGAQDMLHMSVQCQRMCQKQPARRATKLVAALTPPQFAVSYLLSDSSGM
jgi:hypothetical protein